MHLARQLLAAALAAAGPTAAAKAASLAALVALVAAPGAARAESPPTTVIRNDGHNGGPAAFPTGFAAGDIIAARLDTGTDFAQLEDIQVLFGGPGTFGIHPVTIKIWEDFAETVEPGPEIFSLDTSLVATDGLQVISVFTGMSLPSKFRVGFVLHESAPPMVGHDLDGTLASDENFVMRAGAGGGWQRSQQAGASGDWIIQARIQAFNLPGPGPGPGPDPVSCGGVTCPPGQFCDRTASICTFECVTEDDCGGAFCNRFGQCVGEGSGCCQTGGGSSAGYAATGLGLGVLALLVRRRRQRPRRP
ncbi:MAG TPA: MYXO-CTERM sorting domain-containing protein [Kofleriaceae bacterium]|nr:MYXO-CTERM sorting domain-containing protein [Kofleriaceae bacterium]